MAEHDHNSGLKTAAKVAQALKSAIRIARAAAAGGIPGAAVQAVKEAAPFLIKLAIGLVIGLVIVPMFAIMSIPNMFFGYESSQNENILAMNTQASAIGGVYYSLADLQKTKMDAVVTGVVSNYENMGVTLKDVSVESDLTNEDLCWLIAIHSVAYQQNLQEMSAETMQALASGTLTYEEALEELASEEETSYSLVVKFKKLNPEELMDKLGFDEDAKTWAGAIFETLTESNALEEYADQFEAYKPSYSGDSSFGATVEPGGGGSGGSSAVATEIDVSGFHDPGAKNNLDLAAYAVQAFNNGWGYVWGTFGDVLTESLLNYKLEQYPELASSESFIRSNWLGGRTTDCVGLIKGYGWLDAESKIIRYNTNGMPDLNADDMYASATESGTMDTMPETIGLALWKRGHIGVYIGGGYAIEAMGTTYGVVRTSVEGRGWQGWCKIPYIHYE